MSDEALQYARAHRDAYLDDLLKYVAIPSVSAQPEHKPDVLRAANWLTQHLNEIGLDSRIMPTGGNPVVYGEWMKKPGAPTVLIYGHYDVQPAEPFDLWKSPPFAPEIRDGAIYARGADDNKGQHMAHIKALDALLRATGELPVNVKIIVEGEEEIGGTNLPLFVREHAAMLACDCVMISDGSLFDISRPTITYGLRGLSQMEVTVKALARDVHSGHFGGNVQNPAVAIAQIIAGLKDAQGRVVVPSFYDDVRPLSTDERAEIAQVPWGPAEVINESGALQAFGDPDFTANERKGARPTLEINGLWSGYTGPGGKTIIPAEAHCKITCRLVPYMDPQKVIDAVQAHIRKLAPPGVEVSFKDVHGGIASLIDRSSPLFQAAAAAAEATYGNPPYYELEGGSIPVVADFLSVLQKPVILLGFGLPTDAIHSPNEKYSVECYEKGIEASVRFLTGLSQK